MTETSGPPTRKQRRAVSRRATLTAASGTAASLLAGCVDTDILGSSSTEEETVTPIEDRQLRVGGLMATTGGLGSIGAPVAEAAELPVQELDGSGITVDYEFRDTETSVSRGITAARELVEDGYPAIVGPLSSNVTLQATQQVTIPEEVVTCSPASTSPTLSVVNDLGYSYRTTPSDVIQSRVAAQIASEAFGADSAVVIHQSDDYGRQLGTLFEQTFSGSVPSRVGYATGQGSYGDIINLALQPEPDLLFIAGYPTDGATLLDSYYEDSDSVNTLLVSESMRYPGLYDATRRPLDELAGSSPSVAGPGADAFESLYEQEIGELPATPFLAHAYDATAVLLLAQAAGGEADGREIRREVNAVTEEPGTEILPGELEAGIRTAAEGDPVHYRGASGEVTFNRNGDVGASPYDQFAFEDGEIVTVDEWEV